MESEACVFACVVDVEDMDDDVSVGLRPEITNWETACE